ncbi:MAPEG family protein [Methylophilaceae bacterium]|jgi:uncharacterized membrane protein YecN with MAPEG domain|nr:MAPEG family protein [Methylophilaceae bacterium]MDB4138016.1 MAPEG family protein [Methylophilaceae bacterium]MDC1173178.1 MAPEG family protein [Methylophilaceae bacterium]|tara:strand:+ start:1026 stop:1415 length:390 start_codon:yes stop_codon:yes gene_type:complete
MITALYASMLGFIYIKLSKNIIRLRRKYNVTLGHKKHADLEQAIRGHANFSEFVPLGLILLACLEINNVHYFVVLSLGGLFFLGRVFHAKSFLKEKIDKSLRVKGMQFTFWSIMLMSGMNIFSILVSFI